MSLHTATLHSGVTLCVTLTRWCNALHSVLRADCGRLTNAFHLSVARLRCSVWLDWVPSKANVADLPSREDGDTTLLDALEGAGLAGAFDEVEFLLPPMQSWSAPLAEFAGW